MRATIAVLALALTATGCDDITGPDDGRWNYSEGTDEVSGQPWANAILSGGSGMDLVVRCRLGSFSVYVRTDFVTSSGRVRYRIDNDSEVTQTWGESEGFDALFYRGDAVAFAKRLANAEKMVFAAREYSGPEHTATFRLPGLEVHLPKIRSKCDV